jgi:SAM-dependent methyltransferase
MKPSYQNLCTEFYDLTMPEAGPKEHAFYRDLLKKSKGPFLEAMSGSGRVLIPLLREGFKIDGMDNSAFMLESCRQRCQKLGLSTQLYNQSIQELSLPAKYNLIFITFGSFQLVHDRAEALATLKLLHRHLLPGGKLVLENFVPWNGIQTGIHDSILSDMSQPLKLETKTQALDGSEIVKYNTVILNFKEQIVKIHTLYEKWKGGKLLLEEEEEYLVRWYHRYEMKLFLEKAGFTSIEIKDRYFEENPHALIYICS